MTVGKRRMVSLPYVTVYYRIVSYGNLPYLTIRTLRSRFQARPVFAHNSEGFVHRRSILTASCKDKPSTTGATTIPRKTQLWYHENHHSYYDRNYSYNDN